MIPVQVAPVDQITDIIIDWLAFYPRKNGEEEC
jgi:hypothetical protein